MHVGDEVQALIEGHWVCIPPKAAHSIDKQSDGLLGCICGATPAFDPKALYETGPSAVTKNVSPFTRGGQNHSLSW